MGRWAAVSKRKWSICPARVQRLKRSFCSDFQLYSLAVARLYHSYGDLLQLRLSVACDDLQRSMVLPNEITRRPVDRDESRQFHPKAILDIGGAQLALLDYHLAVRGWCCQPHGRHGPRGAVLADGGKNSSVNVSVRLAFDFALLDGTLLRESESRQRKQCTECG